MTLCCLSKAFVNSELPVLLSSLLSFSEKMSYKPLFQKQVFNPLKRKTDQRQMAKNTLKNTFQPHHDIIH